MGVEEVASRAKWYRFSQRFYLRSQCFQLDAHESKTKKEKMSNNCWGLLHGRGRHKSYWRYVRVVAFVRVV